MGWRLRGLMGHVPLGPRSWACLQDPSPTITCEAESGSLPSRNSAPGWSVDGRGSTGPALPRIGSPVNSQRAERRSTQGVESGDRTHSPRARALGSPGLSPAAYKALPAPGLRVPPAGFSGQNNAAPAAHTGVPATEPLEPVPGEPMIPGGRYQGAALAVRQDRGGDPRGAVLTEASVKTVRCFHSSSPPSDYLNFITSVSGPG